MKEAKNQKNILSKMWEFENVRQSQAAFIVRILHGLMTVREGKKLYIEHQLGVSSFCDTKISVAFSNFRNGLRNAKQFARFRY